MKLINTFYDGINSVYQSAYQGASSLYDTVSLNVGANTMLSTLGVICLNEVNRLSTSCGRNISALTNGYIELNHFVPASLREAFQTLGQKCVAPCNRKIGAFAGRLLRIPAKAAQSFIAAPIVEECVFRLPF